MDSFKIILKQSLKTATDFLFPRRCIVCGKVNPKGNLFNICPECSDTIRIVTGGRCLVCSEIVSTLDSSNVLACHRCRKHKPHFNWSMVSCIFDDAVRDMILGLKYNKAIYVLKDIKIIMQQTPSMENFFQDAIIVPVPLHKSRRFKRPYNQSLLIAQQILKAYPKSNCKILEILKRTKKSHTQTTLTRKERIENISNAFQPIKSKIDGLSPQSRIVIVDDVMTTTATLSECAKVLKELGFKDVDAYAFARRI